MFPLLTRRLLEVLVETGQGDVVTAEKGGHGHVNIRGVQLQIDLPVDRCLTVGMVVLPGLGH